MRDLPQYQHADLGLIEDDNTEDMRKPPAATEGVSEVPTTHISRSRK